MASDHSKAELLNFKRAFLSAPLASVRAAGAGVKVCRNMETRTKVLFVIFMASSVAMCVFLATKYKTRAFGIVAMVCFGVGILGGALYYMNVEKQEKGNVGFDDIAKASFGIAFGLLILSLVIALPFVGFAVLDSIIVYGIIVWPVLALLLLPIVSRYLR
jgi:hypothetical protein